VASTTSSRPGTGGLRSAVPPGLFLTLSFALRGQPKGACLVLWTPYSGYSLGNLPPGYLRYLGGDSKNGLMAMYFSQLRDYSGGSTPFGEIADLPHAAYNRLTLVRILRQVPGGGWRGCGLSDASPATDR